MYPGTLELPLQAMPSPAKSSRKCNLDMLPEVLDPAAGGDKSRGRRRQQSTLISLFDQKRTRGFWPCYRRDERGQRQLTVLTHVHGGPSCPEIPEIAEISKVS